MKFFKFKRLTAIALLSAIVLSPLPAKADAVVGDQIITLGEDLTVSQQNKVFEQMGIDATKIEKVYVSNKEEHDYLGSYISKEQIGTKALSSALITMGDEESGLVVETSNISYISPEMYRDALSTAGITDAKIFVTAPFKVSGTGALTGIMKAYEESTGVSIDEEQKQIANEEMVVTAELSETTGSDKASEFMTTIKEEINENDPKTEEDLRAIIIRVANEMGINLTDDQIQKYVDLFWKIKDLNIDWDKVGDSLNNAKEKWDNFVNSEETKNIIDSFMDFLRNVWDWILSIFQKDESETSTP